MPPNLADLGRVPIDDRAAPPSGIPIPVRRGLADHDLVKDEIPTIEIPDMPILAPPLRPASPPRADALSAAHPVAPDTLSGTHPVRPNTHADRMSDTNPIGHAAPEPDDTLSKRMGKPFASLSQGEKPPSPPEIVEKIEFFPERPVGSRPARRATDKAPRSARTRADADADDTLPRGASAHRPSRDFVAEMWRPAAELDSGDDMSVSRMWTPSPAEIEVSIGEARTRDEIGRAALETFLVDLPRVLLLGCGKTAIAGWQGRGGDLTPEVVVAIRIPLSKNNVFASVRASGVPHFGLLESDQWPRAMADTLGEKAPDCAVFPIRILDDTAAFLYADRLGEPMHYEDFAVIARAAGATANALARFLLRRSKPTPVV